MLASQGHLRRLWALAAQQPMRRALGLGNAGDFGELSSIVQSLPLHAWMTTTTTELLSMAMRKSPLVAKWRSPLVAR